METRDNVVAVNKIQLWLAIIAILISVIGSAVGCTMYINSIERRQSILEIRVEAFEKYGSGPARDAILMSTTVASKQISDMAQIDLKLKNLELVIHNISTTLTEVRADVKENLKRNKNL